MRRVALLAMLGGLLALPSAALICTSDNRPAATLLLPYFAVDLNPGNPLEIDTSGINTLFSVNNAGTTPIWPPGRRGDFPPLQGGAEAPIAVLAHVVLWSDLSVPVLDFNVYLTSYDVQTINLRDILVHGVLPHTASAGQDPADLLSPQGAFSADIDFASCDGQLPLPDLPPSFLAHLQAALTGKFSPILGGCAGIDHGDNIARGYVTIDTVNNCTLRFPGDPGYFVSGGLGDATNQNVLWGDYFYVNPSENFAQGETLVHIEADAESPETSVPGQYTFYGRYVGWTAADNREPLATQFAVRYLQGGAFDGGTSLVVWRDSKVNQGAFKCGTLPSWYPLGQARVLAFDEEENPTLEQSLPVSPQPPAGGFTPFPAEANAVEVGGAEFPVVPDFGWLFLDLNTSVTPAGAVPPEDPLAAQAWVSAAMDAEGRFSVGFDAIQLDSACAARHAEIGN